MTIPLCQQRREMAGRFIPLWQIALLVSAYVVTGCITNTDIKITSKNSNPPPSAPTLSINIPKPTTQEKPDLIFPTQPPVKLVGLDRDKVFKHLGQPVFQRQDHPALLMRYRHPQCILDLFLYPNTPAKQRVSVYHVEARTSAGQLLETRPCIDAIVALNSDNS